MSQKTLIVGSVAFDVIFNISQDFREAIPLTEGEIKTFNASYTAEQKQEVPGGNGGNQAFWIGAEGQNSCLFTAYGKDFISKGYAEKLKQKGVDIRGPEGEFTAHAYMISDTIKQQMAIWQPNAWHGIESAELTAYYSEEELSGFEYAIFSVLPPQAMLKQLQDFRTHNTNALVFFDPGQVTSLFDSETFAECLNLADVLIGNEVEFTHFKRLSPIQEVEGTNTVGLVIPPKSELEHKVLIKTLGEQGCCLRYGYLEECFSAPTVENVLEPTGAGDAFRAGLISQLQQGKSFSEGLKRANELGAQCVRLLGPQP